MPRASEYLQEGYTYHLTQRCHNREFLLRFVRDRDAYREWFREGVARHGVPVYGFCLTSNHVHVVLHATDVEAVSALMHLASGSTAKQYNLRKGRTGSMWQHPYQCTVVEDGAHLFNCLCYVDMNMVRAGRVSHPREWRWCGHDELVGARRRYCLLDVERLLRSLEVDDVHAFRKRYTEAIERRLADGQLAREPHWTESLVVGSRGFVESTQREYSRRYRFDTEQLGTGEDQVWVVREQREAYAPVSPRK